MEPIEKTAARSNALASEFLLVDSEMAISFLDRAKDGLSREHDRRRRFETAARAYKSIVKFLPHVTLTAGQYEVLMRNLTILRNRLDRHWGPTGR
jgi:hypothetical protein